MSTKTSKYSSDLAAMKKSWNQSEKEYEHTFGGETVPDAVYFMKLQDLKLAKTKSKKFYVAREWLIVKGEYKGVPVRDMLFLSTDKGFVYLRQFIMMMGHKCPSSPTQIEGVLAEIKDEAKLTKSSVTHSHSDKGDFTNVRINQLVKENSMSKDYELDDLDKKGLKKLIKKEELDVDPEEFDDVDELRDAVQEALEERDEENGDGDPVDPDDMDEDEIRDYIDENDIDIEDLGFEDKKEYKKAKEKTLRKALAKWLEENGSSDKGGADVDPDDMDEDEIREYIEENEIDIDDLGFGNKKEYKKADEDDLKEALTKYLKKSKKSSKKDDDDEDSGKGKKGKGKKGKGKDDLVERAKTFCGAWDIDIEDDDDLKAIKKLIAKDGKEDAEYPEDELDEDEVTLLEELGLENTIQKTKKKGKGKGKK
jgi:hypothetical protein